MLQNVRVTAFTVSELLRENQQRTGVKLIINLFFFFDQLVKNKQEAYEKLTKMSRNDEYAIGTLLDYWCRFIKTNKYKYSSTN